MRGETVWPTGFPAGEADLLRFDSARRRPHPARGARPDRSAAAGVLYRRGASSGAWSGDKGGFGAVEDTARAARCATTACPAGAPLRPRPARARRSRRDPRSGGRARGKGGGDLVKSRGRRPFGGMKTFNLARATSSSSKPNIGWDRLPIPRREHEPRRRRRRSFKLAFDAGAKKVVVADGSCNDPTRCFQRSGIWPPRPTRNGAEVIPPRRASLPDDAPEGGGPRRVADLHDAASTPTRSSTSPSPSTTTSPSTPRR